MTIWLTGIASLAAMVFTMTVSAAERGNRSSIYDADYFADLNVLTARDMVNRIPGSEALLAQNPSGGDSGSGRRGLRDKTDRVLIDGKRITGKANEADNFLARLPANKVIRIEVYDGIVVENESSAGARTIDIITSGEGGGSGTWGASLKWLDGHRTTSAGNFNYSGKLGQAAYNLGVDSIPNGSLTHREDTVRLASTAAERAFETRERYAHKTRATASALIPIDDSRTLQLNALYERQPRRGSNHVDNFAVEPDGSLTSVAFSDEPLERTVRIFELGGTYAHRISDANRFEVLFLRNANDDDRQSRKTIVFVNGNTELNHEVRDEQARETVVRGTWYKADSYGGDLDLGLELAVNSLDKAIALFEGTEGALLPVPIPNADQVIREDRAEVFVNYAFTMSALHLRLGLAAEYSEFDQQGSDVSQNRTLDFVKPSLNVSYEQSGDRRFFMTIVRDVSQLDFDDFVASIDPVDRELRAGNPNLVPETSWDLELGVENQLAADAGLLKLRVFHRWVRDVDDLIPLPPDDFQPGNLPDGRHWGVKATVGLRFAAIGIPGAVLNGFFTWQDSETSDPFTGETRRFLNQKRYEAGIDYRHDLQRFRGAYGLKWASEGGRNRYEHDRIDSSNDDDAVEVFVEKRLRGTLTLRLAANQLPEPRSTRHRRSFEPDRAIGMQVSTSDRTQVLRRSVTLSLSGSF